jgi:hypothetical protein
MWRSATGLVYTASTIHSLMNDHKPFLWGLLELPSSYEPQLEETQQYSEIMPFVGNSQNMPLIHPLG